VRLYSSCAAAPLFGVPEACVQGTLLVCIDENLQLLRASTRFKGNAIFGRVAPDSNLAPDIRRHAYLSV
jgi:hypothetical protein